MISSTVCSIEGCKRATTCLCHHCNQNVCFKHLSEHQALINNELLPLTDRLNELKMKLRTKDNSGGTLAMLKLWRDKKISEIEEEYNRKVQEFDAKISKQDGEVSTIIAKTEELINEGEASFEQVIQLKKDIQIMENQVNKLMQIEQTQIPSENTTAQFDLINTYVQFGHQKILIKERISCRDQDLYAVESETPAKCYDGLCPRCRTAHVSFQPNRGYYVSTDSLHEYIKIRKMH